MGNTLLVVDDLKFNRVILKNLLNQEYEIAEAENGAEALEIIEKKPDEICGVLLDLVMPVMNGVEFLKQAGEKGYLDRFPVLVVTAEQEINQVQECFDYGVSDFIRKPVNTEFVKSRVDRLVELYRSRNQYKAQADKHSATVTNQYRMLQAQSAKLKKTNENMVKLFGTIIEYRNLEESNHIERVRAYTEVLANHVKDDYPEYELTTQKVEVIVATSALHDVGKIMIPESILCKPGKLNDEEFEMIKAHSIYGYDLLDKLIDTWEDDYINTGREIARWHHEKYDGKGYPDGLVGDAIPISAQLVSLADCFESLTNDSVYREAYSAEEAYDMIRKGNCGVFSPKLLLVFSKAKDELERLSFELRDRTEEDEEVPGEEEE